MGALIFPEYHNKIKKGNGINFLYQTLAVIWDDDISKVNPEEGETERSLSADPDNELHKDIIIIIMKRNDEITNASCSSP